MTIIYAITTFYKFFPFTKKIRTDKEVGYTIFELANTLNI